MLISPVTALIEGLTLLTEYPFLICDGFGDMEFYIYDKDNITMSPEELATNVDDEGREETIESPYELRQRYPSVEEDLIPESLTDSGSSQFPTLIRSERRMHCFHTSVNLRGCGRFD